MQKIELKIPVSLNEALEWMNKDHGIKPIAGGTDLLPYFHKMFHIEQLKAQPILIEDKVHKLIDLSNLNELKLIERNKNYIEIGSCVTHAEFALNSIINQMYPSLKEAVSKIGSPQIRNSGTIGGNIANASPSADTVPPLFVLRAKIILLSASGTRTIPVEKFFVGPGETIKKTNEIIYKILIPLPESNQIQIYRRLAARKVHACAKASIAIAATKRKNLLEKVHIALGAVGPTVIYAQKTAQLIEQQQLTPDLIVGAVQQVKEEINPIDDIRSTKEYRRAMIGELLRQEMEKILNL